MKRLKHQARLVDAWKNTPVGIAVVVTKDDGTEFRTTTRSDPWLLSGHTAVIMVVGIAGGYMLERVRKDAAPAVEAVS